MHSFIKLFFIVTIFFLNLAQEQAFAMNAHRGNDCKPEIRKQVEAEIDLEFNVRPKKWDQKPKLMLCKEVANFIPLSRDLNVITLFDFAEWNENSGEDQDVTLKIYNIKNGRLNGKNNLLFLVNHLGVGNKLLSLSLRASKGKMDDVLTFMQGDFNRDEQVDFAFRISSSLNHEELSKIYFFTYENLRKKIISIKPSRLVRLETKQILEIDEFENGYPLLTSSSAIWDDSAMSLEIRPDLKLLAKLKGSLTPEAYGTPWDSSALIYTFNKSDSGQLIAPAPVSTP